MRQRPALVQAPSPFDALIYSWLAADGSLTPRIGSGIPTLTRAGDTATRWNAAGVLETLLANMPRFAYNPVTLAVKGLHCEGASTNVVRNNSMVGAAAGSPGTLPTNWSITGAGAGGLTQSIELGTEAGIPYIDIRLAGTSAGGVIDFVFDSAVATGFVQNDFVGMSSHIALVGGSSANLSGPGFKADVQDGASAFLQTVTYVPAMPIAGALAGARLGGAAQITSATANQIAAKYFQVTAAAAAVDVTFRFGFPQFEEGHLITSIIPTTSAAVLRNGDVCSLLTSLIAGINLTTLTIVVEFMVDEWEASVAASGGRIAVALDDGSQVEEIIIGATTGTTQLTARARDASVNQATLNLGSIIAAGTVVRAVFSIKANDFAGKATPGGTLQTDVSGTVPTPTTLQIGKRGSANSTLYGYVRRIDIYARDCTDAEVDTLLAAA